MGKKRQNPNSNDIGALKNWKEVELLEMFDLNRINSYQTRLMKDWLDVQLPELNSAEQYLFDAIYELALDNIEFWDKQNLKMKFIWAILYLGYMRDDSSKKLVSFFDKTISATVDKILLHIQSDYMFSKGILNIEKIPYYHFQVYKSRLNPMGEPMAELLEAFLIAQVKNQNGKPLYGVEIVGKHWTFVTMKGKEYCISNTYEATKKNDLLSIIAILRKFRTILYERLLD
jgi:hypothetical protein